MEADKVKFLDGLEAQAELEAIWQEEQRKLFEEQQRIIDVQRREVAQKIETAFAEAKAAHRRICVLKIESCRLTDEVHKELNAAHWDVDLCEDGIHYQLVPMDMIHTSDVPPDAPATPA